MNSDTNRTQAVFVPIGLFLFALGCRILLLLQLRNYPLLDFLGSDPGYYYGKAVAIVRSGNWLGETVFFASPFYQYFLAVTFSLFGVHFLPVRIIQFCVGSGTAVLVYLIGKRCFDRATALLAGGLYSLYLLFPFYEATLEYDPWLLFFVMLSLTLTFTFRERWSLRKSLFLGLLLGLSFTMRPNVLLFLIPFWLFTVGRERRLAISKILFSIVLFFTGFVLILAPIAVRNYWVGREVVLVSAHGGEAFYTGNNPYTDGSIARVPGVEIGFAGEERDFLNRAFQETGKRGYRPASAFWYRKGLEFIRENPKAYLRLLVNKAVHLARTYEIPDNNDYQFAKTFFSPFLKILSRLDYGLILAFASYGVMIGFNRRRETRLLSVYLLLTFLGFLLFPIVSRYRLLIVPPLIIFAAFACRHLAETLRRGPGRALASFLLVFLPVYLLSTVGVKEESAFAHSYFSLGRLRSQQGRSEEAVHYYRQALSEFPTYADLYVSLAHEYQKMGRVNEAAENYKKAVGLAPDNPKAWNNLAVLELRRGNLPAALGSIQQALGQNPGSIKARVVKAKIVRALGKETEAVRLLEEALQGADASGDKAEVLYISGLLQDRPGAVSPQEDPFREARAQMVEGQLRSRRIRDGRLLEAMGRVPRERFVPPALQGMAYEDGPLPIGEGQTISQPYIVALMTELLELEGKEKVLEIGTGSGYQAALLAELAQEVYSIEILPGLARQAEERLRRLGYQKIHLKTGDGYLGWPEEAPFDAILLTAAPETVPPPLLEQLKEGGTLVAPVGPTADQVLWRFRKKGETITREEILPVRFVPFLREETQKKE